jgi:hypothetical protein
VGIAARDAVGSLCGLFGAQDLLLPVAGRRETGQ